MKRHNDWIYRHERHLEGIERSKWCAHQEEILRQNGHPSSVRHHSQVKKNDYLPQLWGKADCFPSFENLRGLASNFHFEHLYLLHSIKKSQRMVLHKLAITTYHKKYAKSEKILLNRYKELDYEFEGDQSNFSQWEAFSIGKFSLSDILVTRKQISLTTEIRIHHWRKAAVSSEDTKAQIERIFVRYQLLAQLRAKSIESAAALRCGRSAAALRLNVKRVPQSKDELQLKMLGWNH